MTDPHTQTVPNAAPYALHLMADAMVEHQLPEPRSIEFRPDDPIQVYVEERFADVWVAALRVPKVSSRSPMDDRRISGVFYDAEGRLGSVRVRVTWLDPAGSPPAPPVRSVPPWQASSLSDEQSERHAEAFHERDGEVMVCTDMVHDCPLGFPPPS